MKIAYILAPFIYIYITSCTKDVGMLPVVHSKSNYLCEDTTRLKPFPPDTGFVIEPIFDGSTGNTAIWRVFYDPLNSDILYFCNRETAFLNAHYLWRYNKVSKTKQLLDKNVLNNLSINKYGWIAYEKVDLNVYIIKTNGDSLKQLTRNGGYFYPTWTEDGKYIYTQSDAVGEGNLKIRVLDGAVVDTLKSVTSAIFSIKDVIYYLKTVNNKVYLAQKNLIDNHERLLVETNATNFFTDENNTTLYWYNTHGLFKIDLISFQTSMVINGLYDERQAIFAFQRCMLTGQIAAVQDSLFYVDSRTLKSITHIVEFTPDGKCRNKIYLP